MMELFEYAIILQAKTDKDGEVVEKAKLLAKDAILARDQEQATLIAGREIPAEHLEHLDRVTLAVRPF